MPYNKQLLIWLQGEARSGRSIILATGADRKLAAAVASHLGLFDAVLASDGQINLTGAAKVEAIRRIVGDQPFSYVGNHHDDLVVWQKAHSGIVVDAAPYF
jgi:cation transport ATPase